MKGFKFWDPTTKKRMISRDVVFDEQAMLLQANEVEKSAVTETESRSAVEVELSDVSPSTPASDEHDVDQHQVESLVSGRGRRITRALVRYGFEKMANYALVISGDDPSNFREAIHSQEKEGWVGVMAEEMESLHKNRTWELVYLPSGKRAIRFK